MKLKIGRIFYLNLFPIFHALRGKGNGYRFADGYPSMLNGMLRRGELDLSPSSSIEYLRHPDLYQLLPGHSISARSEIRSILFVTKYPINELSGKKVCSTHHSETSRALLEIVLKKFYKQDVKIDVTELPLEEALKTHDAYLAIGDQALFAGKSLHIDYAREFEDCLPVRLDGRSYIACDLGVLWRRATGKPFVFALWIANKNSLAEKKRLFDQFTADLEEAKTYALSHLHEIARQSGITELTEEELVSYWNVITYGFGEEEREGLELFRRYSRELGLI